MKSEHLGITMNTTRKLIALPLLIALVNCAPQIGGEDDDPTTPPNLGVDAAGPTELFPNGLECPTVSMCSNFRADPSRVEFPGDTIEGGTLLDGMYRPVQGTSLAYVLVFAKGKWARVMPNLTVQYGDFELLENNQYRLIRHTTCANEHLNDEAFLLETDYYYQTDGNELLVFGGCGSASPSSCNSPVRLQRVDSLCEDLDNLVCEDGDCKCVPFSDSIPVYPEDDSCAF